MNRSDVILELQLVPELLKQAEAIYVDAVSELAWAKHQLLAKECEVIGDGMVTGKNELHRQAEMWPYTKDLQQQVLRMEDAVEHTKVEFHFYKRKLENLQIIAKLMTIL
ncbi:hypothetical protein QFZ77_005385 [Paenibacillus sp. V4I3]|jgi:hypothetical protein|uniref:DUF5082 domain-containing protein n=2 Tax=Paenibacillus TaxID=44249 RepID=A0ABX1YVL0_9BACL|nr:MULTISPECIES: hypothetical protein [Paenibacillus]KQX64663.1 hypothetical protein ASD40_02410 [Paenibacillus sp. Root444D2]KRE51916.1 hypothetical protein ASG85_01890 [Paenibacillus sp. Soil724D2]KRF32108.1 hypothetical protein ASG93_07270 [Paenibacillus sp. Soil787]MDQ0876726.1 hypothetical protein [Paenibacillus sp. V4I3]MDQ0887334.1 hypothetical protein [Paenibacillus sp. V4I9]